MWLFDVTKKIIVHVVVNNWLLLAVDHSTDTVVSQFRLTFWNAYISQKILLIHFYFLNTPIYYTYIYLSVLTILAKVSVDEYLSWVAFLSKTIPQNWDDDTQKQNKKEFNYSCCIKITYGRFHLAHCHLEKKYLSLFN